MSARKNSIVKRTSSIIIAASNSSNKCKAQADYVCDGKDDQVELLKSITQAIKCAVKVDIDPASQKTVECYGKHSVVWLPGDYYLDKTLTIPDAADCVINAEGSYFHYQPMERDAVIITGMNRCRYYFGTIESNSTDAALRVKPAKIMPALMSKVSFTGLVGSNQKGTGLYIDPSVENVCTNKFEGTDISGFDKGVYIGDAAKKKPDIPGSGKCDTNWFWFSYIRMCNTCIWEKGRGVDDGVWNVNVDASIPDSIGIRTAAMYGKWYLIMGTWDRKGTKAVVLDPGASHNVLEVHPPIEEFEWEDNSGNSTNVILSTKRFPYRG